jgi:hypothetical protein
MGAPSRSWAVIWRVFCRDVGNGEAAFLALLFALGVGQVGVYVNPVVLGFAGGVHDEETDVVTHLRGGEAHPTVIVHDPQHLLGEVFEGLVEDGDGSAGFFESGVGVFDDLEVVVGHFMRCKSAISAKRRAFC